MVTIGNDNANKFWERHLKGTKIDPQSPREIRESFIRSKYESKSWIPLDIGGSSNEELNQALCTSVANSDLMKSMELLVLGADPCYQVPAANCELDTPLAIAKGHQQLLQVELLEQNGALISQDMTDNALININKKGYLQKTGSDRQGWRRRYCTIDCFRGLEYFRSETDHEILGCIKCEDILGVSQYDDEGDSRFCFEVVTAGRPYLFKADNEHDMEDWISTIKKMVPKDAADKLGYDKVGYLKKKTPQHITWRRKWFALKGRTLTYVKNKEEVESIDLRTVTELKGPDPHGNMEAQCSFCIVTSERTYSLRSDTPADAESWMQLLKQTQVSVPLSEHLLISSGNIPIIVHKCIQFIELVGLQAEGLYRKSGEKVKIRKLIQAFNQDPRSVMINEDAYGIHDVTGVLKQFFRTLPDPLFTHKLYQAFLQASLMTDHENQMYQLQTLLDQLPEVNRETLKKVIGHLLKVIQYEADNKMSQQNIISLFGPTLMTVDGDEVSFNDSRAQYACVNHMLNYYKWLFGVNEDEEKKEEAMQTALEKIKTANQQHRGSTLLNTATSFIISIYITNKEGGACTMKITMTTTAAEVVEFVTTTKSLAPRNYALFLVLGDAESERPLHSLEAVLAVQKSDSYFCIKPNTFADKLLEYDDAYKGQCINLHIQEKRKWKRYPCKVKDRSFIIYKDSKCHNELSHIPISELDVFVGIERKNIDVRNPLPTKFPLWLMVRFGDQSKFLCADSANDRLLMLSAIIFAKYPDGIQTPILPTRTTPANVDIKNRGISILHPHPSPTTSPTHNSTSYNHQYSPSKTMLPRAMSPSHKGLVDELRRRGDVSDPRTLS
jgi:hypothetical protein